MGKAWTLVGIPLVVIATAALAKVENEENGKGEEEDGGGDGKEEGEEGEEKNGAKEKARGGEEWYDIKSRLIYLAFQFFTFHLIIFVVSRSSSIIREM